MTLKIFGHKSPDTDATATPIIWSEYLKLQNAESNPYVLGEPNTEALFVLKRWGFDTPALLEKVDTEDDVIIVDTNNIQELPAGINEANILQIIDHHKLVAGLETRGPIQMTIRPLASTASVMATLMGEDLAKLPDNVLGLMLSCVLSDTLEFRSPTTTDFDRGLAIGLAQKLGLDISEYAAEMFAAKSDISHFSDKELLRLDSKKYEVGGKNFRVSVLETTTPSLVLERKDSLLINMETVAKEDDVDQVLLFIIDILNEEATLLVPNDLVKNLAEKSFDTAVTGDTIVLPGIVSRKKQIIPALKI